MQASRNINEANHKLMDVKEEPPIDRGSYQRMVGKLIYLSHTRPDITWAVSVVSQFMHSPLKSYLEVVYRILKYLKSSLGKGILYQNNGNLRLEVYTNVDWAGSLTDKRSIGYCTLLEGNLVTWRSKKQSWWLGLV